MKYASAFGDADTGKAFSSITVSKQACFHTCSVLPQPTYYDSGVLRVGRVPSKND